MEKEGIPTEISKRRRKRLNAVDEDVEMKEEEGVVSDLEMEKQEEDEKKEEGDAIMQEMDGAADTAATNDKQIEAAGEPAAEVQETAKEKRDGQKLNNSGPSPPLIGTTTLQRLAQGLRLPSQHTPKPPSVNMEGTTPAPPGGRRLFFETTKKKENKLLLNLRDSHISQNGVVDDPRGGMEVESPPTMERTPLEFESKDWNRDAVFYFGIWTVVLFSFYLMVNTVSYVSGDSKMMNIFSRWDVRRNALLQPNIANATMIEAEEPQIIEHVVKVVDPAKLNDIRSKIELHRKEDHDRTRVNNQIEQAQKDLDMINQMIKQLSAKSPYLANLLATDSLDLSQLSNDASGMKSQLESLHGSALNKQQSLKAWEAALKAAEESMDQYTKGEIDQEQMNLVLQRLSSSSLVGASARIIDPSKLTVPGEECAGKDYVHAAMENSPRDDKIEVVGGIDIEALDNASDAPVRLEEAQAAFRSLMHYVQSTVTLLVGQGKPFQNWVQHLIDGEWKKEGLEDPLKTSFEPLVAPKSSVPSSAYTKFDALNDIDRLLEIESADRTGQLDHATVIHGARVLRRGPYATSPSLFETLPLLNRLLAYTKLRFYGHPPEVALIPSSNYGRGQCWSFTEERRSGTNGEIRGEYGTLTIRLDSPTFVTEVVMEHLPSGDMSSAVREFRVMGFEDGGAFGEPHELGSFQYDTKGG